MNLALPRVVSRPQLGVTAQALTDQLAEFLGVPGKKGILISSVTAGSPAASVLRAGDVIISIDGKTATDPSDLSQAVAGKEPGSKVDLKVIRDKKEIDACCGIAEVWHGTTGCQNLAGMNPSANEHGTGAVSPGSERYRPGLQSVSSGIPALKPARCVCANPNLRHFQPPERRDDFFVTD